MRVVVTGFKPCVWSDDRVTFTLLIPECELQWVRLIDGKPDAHINRPSDGSDVPYWLKFACEAARDEKGALILCCDTEQQSVENTTLAAMMLPNHYLATEELARGETHH